MQCHDSRSRCIGLATDYIIELRLRHTLPFARGLRLAQCGGAMVATEPLLKDESYTASGARLPLNMPIRSYEPQELPELSSELRCEARLLL
eukprot:6188317-Pleurochrysis_carterae.AAC.2